MAVIVDCFKQGALRLRADKIRLALFLFYVGFTIFSSVYFFIGGFVRNGFLPILYALLFVTVLCVFEYFLKMKCSSIFLIIVFAIPVGGILGSCFDFYILIPDLDNILHGLSGFIFAALGFSLTMALFRRNDGKYFTANLMFGTAFSLGLATLWELFEWGLSSITGSDMLTDTTVHEIRSYLLSGSHNSTVDILNIEKTQIFYDGGKMYEIEGYMDLGGLDSLLDMAVCLAGAVIFIVLAIICRRVGKKALHCFIPALDTVE